MLFRILKAESSFIKFHSDYRDIECIKAEWALLKVDGLELLEEIISKLTREKGFKHNFVCN